MSLSPLQEFETTVSAAIAAFPTSRLIQRIEKGTATLAHYHAILLTVFHQTYLGPYNMALAAHRCSWRHEKAKEYLLRHAIEEQSHWRWVLDDLRATGYGGPDPRTLFPHITCEAYVSFAERVSEQAPYARLATNSVLEGIAAEFGGRFGALLIRQLGLKRDQVSFFINHGDTDKAHVPEIRGVIADCTLNPIEWGWMHRTAAVAGAYYRGMYDHEAFA